MSYHIGRLVLSLLCVGAFVAVGIWWCSFCRLQPAKRTPPNTNRNKSSNTQRTENKTTDVVIHQHSRKLLKMDILMSEACWAHNKWNKIASDIKLVFHLSTKFTFIYTKLKLKTCHIGWLSFKNDIGKMTTVFLDVVFKPFFFKSSATRANNWRSIGRISWRMASFKSFNVRGLWV